MSEKMFSQLLPSYFNEFKCIGGSCKDTCCAGWRIDIDENNYKKYRKEKNPLIKDTLHKNIKRNRKSDSNFYNKASFKMDENEKCTMLTKDGLCSIQNILGEESLCLTCTTYPRRISLLNNTIEKSLSLSCPEATRLVLNNPNGLDFIEELTTKKPFFSKNIQNSSEDFNLFWKIRIFAIDTLQNRKHSLETRILVLSMFIQSYINLEINDRFNKTDELIKKYNTYLATDNLNLKFKKIPINYNKQLEFAKEVLNHSFTLNFDEISLIVKNKLDLHLEKPVLNSIKKFKESIKTIYDPFLKEYDFVLENFLVNAIFTEIKSPEEKSLVENFTKVCMDFTIIRLLLIGYLQHFQTYTIEEILYCVQKYSKALSHNPSYERILKVFLQQPHASILSQITMMIHI